MNFHLRSIIKMRFQAPLRKGTYQYELHVKPDSYVGCDRSVTFKVVVEAAPAEVKAKADAAGEPGDPLSHSDKEIEEEPPENKWYYLWHSRYVQLSTRVCTAGQHSKLTCDVVSCVCLSVCSLWELLLNAVILSVAFFFLYDWMQKKGYWQAYCDPILARAHKFAAPVLNALAPVYNTVIAPVYVVILSYSTPIIASQYRACVAAVWRGWIKSPLALSKRATPAPNNVSSIVIILYSVPSRPRRSTIRLRAHFDDYEAVV
jgi:hypothetical protein